MNRVQRQLNIEAQLREMETQRAVVERKIAGAGSSAEPEWTHELTMLQARIADAERELDTLTAGSQREQGQARAVFLLNQWYGDMQARLTKLEHRIERWVEEQSQERHERQEALDDTLEEIRRLVHQNAQERKAQLHQLYWLIVALGCGEVLLGIGLVFSR